MSDRDLVTPAELRAAADARAKRDADREAKRKARPKGRRNLARVGKRVERIISKRFRALGFRSRRVPGSGSIEGTEDGDVLLWLDGLGKIEHEVKARNESGWKTLERWRDGADVLVLWELGHPDRARVFMELALYEALLKETKHDAT